MEGPGPRGPGEVQAALRPRRPSTPRRPAGWPTPGARATPRSGSGRSCRTSSRCAIPEIGRQRVAARRPGSPGGDAGELSDPWIVSGPTAASEVVGPEPVRRAVSGTSPEKSHRPAGRAGSSARRTPRRCSSAWRSTEDAYLQLDDVVVTVRAVPGRGPVTTAGVVTEVRARHEGATYGSDVFLIAEGVLPAQVQEIAEVTTTRVEPEVYVPPRPGRRSPTGPPARSAPRRCTSTRWSARSRPASAATATRST